MSAIKLTIRKTPFKRNPYLRDKIGLTDFSLKSRFYCIIKWLMTGTSPKTSNCGGVAGAGLRLIGAVLGLQSQFKDCKLA